jgi:quercetin dioxygenase-like cupin family protein
VKELSMTLERLTPIAVAVALAVFAVVPDDALAQSASDASIAPAFNEMIPNIPGKSIVAVVVKYGPGGKSPPHRHSGSAFVVGYVLSGAIRSQVDGGPVQVFHAGESWSEKPGAHHGVSENASATEPASLLAIFVADTGDTQLTIPEKQQTEKTWPVLRDDRGARG